MRRPLLLAIIGVVAAIVLSYMFDTRSATSEILETCTEIRRSCKDDKGAERTCVTRECTKGGVSTKTETMERAAPKDSPSKSKITTTVAPRPSGMSPPPPPAGPQPVPYPNKSKLPEAGLLDDRAVGVQTPTAAPSGTRIKGAREGVAPPPSGSGGPMVK
jgi:hypothetical protein